MRKYFLLSAVAILVASNVNAENVSGKIDLNAEIVHTTELTCTDWNLGTIYIPKGTSSAWGKLGNDFSITSGITQVSGYSAPQCNWGYDDGAAYDLFLPSNVSLSHTEDEFSVINLSNIELVDNVFCADVEIMTDNEEMSAGQYTGSFTFMRIEN